MKITGIEASVKNSISEQRKIVHDAEKRLLTYEKFKNTAKDMHARFEVSEFVQLWGSTATAFDIDPYGRSYCGGDAMTEAITTVCHETESDICVIYVDNEYCYTVINPNKQFVDDFQKKNLEARRNAKKLYNATIDTNGD